MENKMSAIFDRTTILGAARVFQNGVRNGDIEGALSSFHDDALYVSQPFDVPLPPEIQRYFDGEEDT